MKKSYSQIQTWEQCKRKWMFRYKYHLKTLPDCDAKNALNLGLGLHKGLETGSVDEAIAEYRSHYHVLTDEMINWEIQIAYQVPRVLELLPKGGKHELKIATDDFIGYADYVCGDTLYDYKFSNNVKNYLNSPQLSIYKHFLEATNPDIHINHLVFVFVPKVNIRQKKKETIGEFRKRLYANLADTQVVLQEVPFNEKAVSDFLVTAAKTEKPCEYEPSPSRLCDWCDYQQFCQSNGEINWNIL